MTLPVALDPLPTSVAFGKVVGRIIYLVADTPGDTDVLPEARPAAGKVTFTPRDVVNRTSGPPAIVLVSRASALLDSHGSLVDAEGRPGIWLAVGVYLVSFSIAGVGTPVIPDFEITVTTEHTGQAPLDLARAAPPW